MYPERFHVGSVYSVRMHSTQILLAVALQLRMLYVQNFRDNIS